MKERATLPDGVSVRRMTLDDVPVGLRLCRASHWNQTERDWRPFLQRPPGAAVVAVRDGAVIGTAATVRYERRFGWVAMVLVDPSERGRGVGRVLLTSALSLLADVETVRLDATPAGEPLYAALGFVEEYRMTRWQRRPAPWSGREASALVRPLAPGDWDDVARIDRQVFGADRRPLLEWQAAGAPEYAWIAQAQGRVSGFVLGRHGHLYEHLGPLVADSAGTARQLAASCLARHADRAFLLDVPDRHRQWRDWLVRAGFDAQRPFARMHLRPHRHRGQPQRLYAALGPEFG